MDFYQSAQRTLRTQDNDMAYTTIEKPSDHFDCPIWTGSDSTTTVNGMGFKPDALWVKRYDGAGASIFNNSTLGVAKNWKTTDYSGATDTATYVASYTSDGFTLTGNKADTNDASNKYFSSCWKAGGTSPTQTYVVKVVSDSGNKYRFDNFGTSAVAIQLQEGGVYTFDQADSSNSGHPLRFSTTANGSHGGGSEYTTGVVVSGTPGNAGAKTVITVASSAPTLYYYCTAHSGMGGTANTNVTTGSSNFAGSILSVASPNTTSGFSLVKWVGTGSAGTLGHGLGVAPKIIIAKNMSAGNTGATLNMSKMFVTDPQTDFMQFAWNNSQLGDGADRWNDGAPTTSVFSVGGTSQVNGSSGDCVAYCFAEVQGFSKFGYYTGNGSTNGVTIYCGFKPKWIMVKNISATEDWAVKVSGLTGYGLGGERTRTTKLGDTDSSSNATVNFESTGFRTTTTDAKTNGNGVQYFYMAFAEMPTVGTNGTIALAT